MDRESLFRLLSRWQAGEVSAWQVVEEAEEGEKALFGEAVVAPDIPRSDPRSIPIAVLELLSTGHHQRLLPCDVPVLLEFLGAKPGEELEAWRKLDEYWNSVDPAAREQQANELYFGPASEPRNPGAV